MQEVDLRAPEAKEEVEDQDEKVVNMLEELFRARPELRNRLL